MTIPWIPSNYPPSCSLHTEPKYQYTFITLLLKYKTRRLIKILFLLMSCQLGLLLVWWSPFNSVQNFLLALCSVIPSVGAQETIWVSLCKEVTYFPGQPRLTTCPLTTQIPWTISLITCCIVDPCLSLKGIQNYYSYVDRGLGVFRQATGKTQNKYWVQNHYWTKLGTRMGPKWWFKVAQLVSGIQSVIVLGHDSLIFASNIKLIKKHFLSYLHCDFLINVLSLQNI